jgi:hypothetical protein
MPIESVSYTDDKSVSELLAHANRVRELATHANRIRELRTYANRIS